MTTTLTPTHTIDLPDFELPEDIEFITEVTPEMIQQTSEAFRRENLERIRNAKLHQEIIIPVNGSIPAYLALMSDLKKEPALLSKVTFRFAVKNGTHPTWKNRYELTDPDKDLPTERETYIIDDIFDEGNSSNSILESINKERGQENQLDTIDVYAASTKQGRSQRLGNAILANANIPTCLIFPDVWVMGTLGMNSGSFNLNEPLDLAIDVLERICKVPLKLTNFKRVFNLEEKNKYFKFLLLNSSIRDPLNSPEFELLSFLGSIEDAALKKRLLKDKNRKLMTVEA